MGFGILGPLEVTRANDIVPLGRPKQRAVLAVLLLHANQVVALDRLLELLWGDQSSRSVGAAQVYISHLRRVLEPDRPPRAPARVLVSQAGGYRLAVEPGAVDAGRFEAELSAGVHLLAQEQPAAARDALTTALGRWRGPALVDFAFEEFARLETDRLERLRLVALETRLEADLALGEHVSAIPDLEQLVAEHPLRERLYASLMLALYRSGRQADALRTYQRCRKMLAAEVGIDPGPGLRRLEGAVLTQDPALDWHPPVSAGAARQRAPWTPDVPSPVPTAPTDLVGRSEPLATLHAAWARACDTRGRFVVVSGEAGIGKTRLAEELVATVRGQGARAIWGRCYEADEAPTFWPWSQILKELLADLDPASVNGALDEVGLDLADLAPVVTLARVDGGAAHAFTVGPAARFRLYRAVAAVLWAAAEERPLALFLDDLQWADAASLQLLRFLATELGDQRVAVVLTHRTAEGRERHPLVDTLAALARQPDVERVELTGLDPAEVGRFIAVATGTEASPVLASAVHRRTEGNPFFMTEIVRLLEAEGSFTDAAAEQSSVPAGVRDVTRRRLAHLPTSSQRLLELAAVAGQEFETELLASAQGIDDEAALDELEPALTSGLVLELDEAPGRYRFVHALVREALYEELNSIRRARLHARVAEALEARDGRERWAAELARHYFLARHVVGAERCIPYLLRAAEAAMHRLAHERAEHHLQRALDLLASLPDSDERDRRELWVQTRLGLVVGTTAGPGAPEVAKVFARARALCASIGTVAEDLPMIYGPFLFAWAGADHATAHDRAGELLDLAARRQDPRYLVGGHLAKGLILFDQGVLGTAANHFEHATVVADSLADPWLAQVLHADPRVTGRILRAHVFDLAGSPERAQALCSDGLALAKSLEHPYSEAVALAMTAFSAVLSDRPEAAQEAAEGVLERSRAQEFSHLAAAASGLRGWAIARQGQVGAGLALVRRFTSEMGASTFSRVRHFHLALTADVELRAGLLDDALATITQALAEAHTTGSRFYEAELHRLRGAALLASSPALVREAERSFIRSVEVARAQGAHRLVKRAHAGLQSCRRQAQPCVPTLGPVGRMGGDLLAT